MALLVLASTVSWTVGKHYCMGHLMDVSLFSQADDCGMGMDDSTDGINAMMDESSCCEDQLLIFGGQDDLKLSFNDFNIDQQLFLVAFVHSYLNSFKVETVGAVSNEYYPPPILIKDIQLLDEVFLI